MVTDNVPQFDSHEMKEFAQAYEFQHTTTSPYFPQSNGFVERMVKMVKKIVGARSRSLQVYPQL